MRKLVVLILATFLMSGCDNPDGSPFNTRHYCIDGVTYYTLGSSLAPAFNRDGTLKLCNK